MRALIQRVSEARVAVGGRVVGRIGPGFLILLGIGLEDTAADARWLAEKTANLRVFAREAEDVRMDLSLLDTGGEALVVSQFTLYGDCRKGRRPDFTAAARPAQAIPLYEAFCQELRRLGITVAQGEFGAYMQVTLVNDGPVTILLETKRGA